MRIKLTLAGAAVVAGLFGSATPAAAYCDPFWTELTGRCDNACTVVGRKVGPAYEKVTGQDWICLA